MTHWTQSQRTHNTTTPDSPYNLFTVTGSGQNLIVLQVTVNQKPIQKELDTDTSLSLINKQTFGVIADHIHIVMKATNVNLKICTGEA